MDSRRVDTILRVTVVILVVAVLGIGAYFGYTYWQDRKVAENATPALRVVSALTKQVKQKPNDVFARVRLGEALAAAGKYQAAVKQLNAALKIDPKHVGAHLDLALVATADQQFAVAKRYYEEVLKLTETASLENTDPRREIALYHLGRIAYSEKDYEAAVGYFRAALRIRDDASDTYVLLARAYQKLDLPDAAVEQLKLALVFDPSFAVANYELGKLYAQQGDTLNAALHLRKAADMSPRETDPVEQLAKLGTTADWLAKARAQMDGDLDAALTAARIAGYLDPQSAAAVRLEAQIRQKKGDKPGAIAAYRNLLKIAPADKEASAAVEALSATKK